MNVRTAFREQGVACGSLGSPFMARLMALLADRLEPGTPVADRMLSWTGDPGPNADSLPLRLAGALHALKLGGSALDEVYPPQNVSDDALWSAIGAALTNQEAHILCWLENPPQTNEVRRSAVVLCGLSRIESGYHLPVDLLELGASGGLNLRADKYRVDLPGRTLGNAQSSVQLQPDWSGPIPESELPDIISRRGVDLSPLDPVEPEDAIRLLVYVWPDQPDRMQRTNHAVEEARRTQADISAGDAGDWLSAVLDAPAPQRLRVVFHTVAWQYFPAETKKKAIQAMRNAQSPLVQLAMEADGGHGARVTLTHWPEGRTETLGRADFHGRWIDWNPVQGGE